MNRFLRRLIEKSMKKLTKDDSASVSGIETVAGALMLVVGGTTTLMGFREYMLNTSGFFGFFGNFNPQPFVIIGFGFVQIIFGVIILNFAARSSTMSNGESPGERKL